MRTHSALPVVIGLMGLPGAGKSTLAHAVSARTGIPCLCRDQLRRALFRGHHGDDARLATEHYLREQMVEHLRQRESVLLDGMTFASTADRLVYAALVRQAGGVWLPVLVDVPLAVARARVAEDCIHARHPAADRCPELVEQVHRRFAPVGAQVLVVDGTQAIEAQAERLIEAMRTARSAPALSA
ncbi:MAG: ATP-binding protein [Xanthomonadales bacterium]|nr:ATP-binding protein [Xanthomonadales bacterium]